MLGLIRGWADKKLSKKIQEIQEEKDTMDEKYKELEKEHEELIESYGEKVEEVNKLKNEIIDLEYPDYHRAVLRGEIDNKEGE